MGGEDGDEHARLADIDAAEAVDDGDVADGIIGEGLGGQPLHLGDGHVFVRLVLQVAGLPSPRIVANDAVKDHDGSVFRPLEGRNDVVGNNSLVDEPDEGRWLGVAAADGRKEGNFVAVGEGMGGGDVFAIDGDGYGGPRGRLFRDERAAAIQEIADGRAAWELERPRSLTEEVAKDAEGEEVNAHALLIIFEPRRLDGWRSQSEISGSLQKSPGAGGGESEASVPGRETAGPLAALGMTLTRRCGTLPGDEQCASGGLSGAATRMRRHIELYR